MPIYYEGSKFTIERTEDAEESQDDAEAGVPPNKLACIVQLDVLIRRLADIGKLNSPSQFGEEGDANNRKIFAIKARCGLRAYGWFHTNKRGVFVISHYILKKHQKMRKGDQDRVAKNMSEYEE